MKKKPIGKGESQRRYAKRRRLETKAAGVCRWCREPSNGFSMCLKHRKYLAAISRERYQRTKAKKKSKTSCEAGGDRCMGNESVTIGAVVREPGKAR